MGYLRDGEDLDQAFARVKREAIGAAKAEMAAMVSAEPKIYVALLTQSGTDAPVANVLKNTLSGMVVWNYNSVGAYEGTLSGAFTENKTFILVGGSNDGDFSNLSSLERCHRVNINSVQILTTNLLGVSTNDLLNNSSIKIEVYP